MINQSEFILQQLNQLRSLTQIDIQSQWFLTTEKSLNTSYIFPLSKGVRGDIAPLNEKGYIVWEKGHQVQYLTQTITIPKSLKSYPLDAFTLRLSLTWWAEDAQIYVNNNLVQSGDLFDSSARIVLTTSAKPGESINIVLRLVSPGHDIGGLMRSRLIYEREYPHLDPSFIADEIAVLAKYLETFEPEKLDNLTAAL
ncbi:MAG: alpha-mannosidase, partial [Microcystaceae cyanobacterium]